MSWEDRIRKVEPYVPGEQPRGTGIIKLNTNECPYPPSPAVKKALAQWNTDELRLYPDTEAGELSAALCEVYGLKPEQLFIGIGSDDVLAMAFLTFFQSGKPIFFPDVTYSFYDVWAKLYGICFETKPLDQQFKIRIQDYLGENGGIIIPNPNAPTGLFEPVESIEEIIRNNSDSVVIIDEAYVDFGGTSCMPLIEQYDNLLVVQTFSKSRSMAGMRIGFAAGSRKLIGYLKDAKFSFNSYTMNLPSILLGAAAVRDRGYFEETTNRIIRTRERVKERLKELGFTFPDSMANFIFAAHKEVPAKELFLNLKEKGIYVRYWEKPRIDNYLRITVGTDAEMDALLRVLSERLAK